MEFIVKAKPFAIKLSEALKFASSEETRYYLNGVYIEKHSDDEVRLVATNGHKLYLSDTEAQFAEGDDDITSAIIPSDAVRLILLELKAVGGSDFPITASIDDYYITLKTPDAEIKYKLIDGTFPQYQKVIPNKPPKKAFSLDRGVANSALNAVKSIGAKSTQWQMGEDYEPIKILADERVIVVMPIRAHIDDITHGQTDIEYSQEAS